MAYGLRIYRQSGALALDYTDRLTRVLFTKELGKNETGSQQIADYDPTKGTAFAIIRNNSIMDLTTGKFTAPVAAHSITHSGNTVYWTPHSQTWLRTKSWLYVVMYK